MKGQTNGRFRVVHVKGIYYFEIVVLNKPDSASDGVSTWKGLDNYMSLANTKTFNLLIRNELNLLKRILNILQIKQIEFTILRTLPAHYPCLLVIHPHIATFPAARMLPVQNYGILLQHYAQLIQTLRAHLDHRRSRYHLLLDAINAWQALGSHCSKLLSLNQRTLIVAQDLFSSGST